MDDIAELAQDVHAPSEEGSRSDTGAFAQEWEGSMLQGRIGRTLRRHAALVSATLVLGFGAGLFMPASASAAASIVHAPVATAAFRTAVPIEATVDCAAPDCSGILYFRTSDPAAALPGLDAYASVPMTMTPLTASSGQFVFTARATIPASATDTRGVDYVFSITDGSSVSWFPGVNAGGGASVGPVTVTAEGAQVPQHIQVREPVRVAHTPVLVGYFKEPFPVAVQAACATGTCSASLSYRTSTGLNTASGIVSNVTDGLDGAGFATVAMTSRVVQDLGADGAVLEFTATIPAEIVDTNGVDYFVQATDGFTNAFFPGTSYVGSQAPVDGTRSGWVHVEVFSRPQLVHVPPGYYVPGRALQLAATVTSATGFPQVTLFYREGGDGGFAALPMTVRETPVRRPEGTVYTATGGIPGFYTAQGGLMIYGFTVDDGYQVTYSPATAGFVDTNVGYVAAAQSSPL